MQPAASGRERPSAPHSPRSDSPAAGEALRTRSDSGRIQALLGPSGETTGAAAAAGTSGGGTLVAVPCPLYPFNGSAGPPALAVAAAAATVAQVGWGGACVPACVWLDEEALGYGDVDLPLASVACLLGLHTAQHGLPPPGLPLRPARARGDPRPPPGPLPGAWLRSRPGRTSPAGAGPAWQLVGLWEWLRRSGAASGDMLVLEAEEELPLSQGAAVAAAAAFSAVRRLTGVSLRLLKPAGTDAAEDGPSGSAGMQVPTSFAANAAATTRTQAPADARTAFNAGTPRRSGGGEQMGADTPPCSRGCASGAGSGPSRRGEALAVLEAPAVEATRMTGAALADANCPDGGGADSCRSDGAHPTDGGVLGTPTPSLISAAAALRSAVPLGGAAGRGGSSGEAQQALPRMAHQAVHAALRTMPGPGTPAAEPVAAARSQGYAAAPGSGGEGLGNGAAFHQAMVVLGSAGGSSGWGSGALTGQQPPAAALDPGSAPDGGGGVSRKRGRDNLEGSEHVKDSLREEAAAAVQEAAAEVMKAAPSGPVVVRRTWGGIQGARGQGAASLGGATGSGQLPSWRALLGGGGSGSGTGSGSGSETESSAYEPSTSSASSAGDLEDESPAKHTAAAHRAKAKAVPGAIRTHASRSRLRGAAGVEGSRGDVCLAAASAGGDGGRAKGQADREDAVGTAAVAAVYPLRLLGGSLRCHVACLQHAFLAELRDSGAAQPVQLYGRLPDGSVRSYDGVRLGMSGTSRPTWQLSGYQVLLADVAGGKDRVASTPFRLAVLEDGRAVVEAGEVTEPEPRIIRASALSRGAYMAVPMDNLSGLLGLSAEQLACLKGHLQLRVRASVAGSPGAEELEGVYLFPPKGKGGWGIRGLQPWLSRSGAAVGDLLALGRAEELPPAPGADAGAGPSTAGAAADGGSVPAITARLFCTGAGGAATAVQQAAEALSPGRAAHEGCTASSKRGCGHADASQAATTDHQAALSPGRVDVGGAVACRKWGRQASEGPQATRGVEDPIARHTRRDGTAGRAGSSSDEGHTHQPLLEGQIATATASDRLASPVPDYLSTGGGTAAASTPCASSGKGNECHAVAVAESWGHAGSGAGKCGGGCSCRPEAQPGGSTGRRSPRLAAQPPAPSCAGLPAASISRLQGYVPPGELPPLRPGELRLCGLTFHPAVDPAVRAALGLWEAAQPGAADPAADPFALQAGPEGAAPGELDPLVLRTSLADLLGLTAPAGAAAGPLPEGPVACGLVAPCGDPAQGHSGLRATARIAAGSAVCVVGGYVLPRGAAEELVASGLSQCRPEVRAQVAATLEGSGSGGGSTASLQAAWRLMVGSLMLPYDLPYGLAEWRAPEEAVDGGPAGTLRLSQLGYGGVGALVSDYRMQATGDEGEGDASPLHVTAPGPNCTILSVSVRGVCLPVLVALRDIAPGERLLRDYGEGWWRELDAAWEAAEREGVALQALL
ncbi:hypothetical protein HYH03_012098 [Edaphochlamys debaryana]|uniref:SET domain-containing protein n=1 Tax=Edaphochlamys debaryana TaxID=47281 RepID=A0A836BUX3_9CHLO|nr:hypothetical protein HYH03_012098 [Edaphochlamys debaryana]|eukprot:KAG2489462.1 hypothetical protein HYH03_012098 [Edaphochlamys debaryana]